MNELLKKIVSSFVMATAVMNLAACALGGGKNEENVLRMLEEKYNQKFGIAEYYGYDRSAGSVGVLAYSREQPDILFEAEAARDGSYLNDEYVAACVFRKIERKMEENIKNMPGDFVLKARTGSKAMDSADFNMSIEAFQELKEGSRYAVYLFYAPKEQESAETYEALKDIARGLPELSGNVQLYIVEEKLLKKVQGYWKEHTNFDYELEELLGDVENVEIPFEKEHLSVTREKFEYKAYENSELYRHTDRDSENK
ncbi:hypothetical protein ABXS75_10885 [Roseburia hominis]